MKSEKLVDLKSLLCWYHPSGCSVLFAKYPPVHLCPCLLLSQNHSQNHFFRNDIVVKRDDLNLAHAHVFSKAIVRMLYSYVRPRIQRLRKTTTSTTSARLRGGFSRLLIRLQRLLLLVLLFDHLALLLFVVLFSPLFPNTKMQYAVFNRFEKIATNFGLSFTTLHFLVLHNHATVWLFAKRLSILKGGSLVCKKGVQVLQTDLSVAIYD